LKNILLCISYSKSATLRHKTLKIIKQAIKIDPIELLQDSQILQIIKLRIEDVSSITREIALDIIHKNMSNLINTQAMDSNNKEKT